MKHIYCISGFGADERIFSKVNFGNNSTHFISWLTPLKKESIEAYAKRMSEIIRHDSPILLGVSFGGIMSIEIAKIIKTDNVIIISSIKSFREIPLWMKLSSKLNLDKIIPLRSFPLIEPIENYNLGLENKEELNLVHEYRKNIGQQYTNWSVNQILRWKNEWQPAKLVHIHGGKDRIFPIKNIKADYVIADGGHFIIMNRAEKINQILAGILQ
jgi:pimeloyl-ACP methyl ester carboxylesterase